MRAAGRIIHSVCFDALAALPVYEAAILIDLFVTNALEFWSGSSASADAGDEQPKKREVELPDGRTAVLEHQGDKRMRVTMLRGGQTESEFVLDGNDESLEMRDGDGRLIAAARDGTSGGVIVNDADGDVLRHSGPQGVASLRDRLRAKGSQGAVDFMVERKQRERVIRVEPAVVRPARVEPTRPGADDPTPRGLTPERVQPRPDTPTPLGPSTR
jgi:hypothetical protein